MTPMMGLAHLDRPRLAAACLLLSRLGLSVFILGFSLGITFREVGGSVATIGVLAYYLLGGWQDSNLRRIPVALRWLLAGFYAVVVFKTFHTIHFSLSWYAFSHGWYNSIFLAPAAMEFVRSRRDLAIAVVLFAVLGFYEGVGGIWQKITGVHPLTGEAIWKGRLTGALGSRGRVGNLMSLVLPVALGVHVLWPARWKGLRGNLLRWGASAVVLLPPLFLLYGARARSGLIGFAAALAIWVLLRFGVRRFLLGAALAAAVLLAGPKTISYEYIAKDPRWEIWHAAVQVFASHPVLGVGINAFNPAFKRLGIVLQQSEQDLPHPHNVYLQLLAETGIVGFCITVALLFGGFVWTGLAWYRRQPSRAGPRAGPRAVPRESDAERTIGFMAAGIVASYAGYLVSALSAHNFFRTWWLGMAMCVIGLALGVTARFAGLHRTEPQDTAEHA